MTSIAAWTRMSRPTHDLGRAEIGNPLGVAQRVAQHERRGGVELAVLRHREEGRGLHLDRQHAVLAVVA